MIANHLNALLIFAKWPEPGRVKTRLSPPLSEQHAAELYRCMLLDTLDTTAEISDVQRMIFFDGDPERAADFRLLAPDATVIRQEGSDLGERLERASEKAFAAGYRQVVIIGADAPHMPVERVMEAFDLLEQKTGDVVFGPSDDGGYYLVALNRNCPQLFRDIPWSSSETLASSREKARSAGLKTVLLQHGFDLDTFDDLRRLMEEPAQCAAAPRTTAFLTAIQVYFNTVTS